MSTEGLADSLLGALSKTRIPVENHQFIREFTSAVGTAEFRAVESADRPHVIATRTNGVPDLHIRYGYTNGFTSEEEIIQVAGSGGWTCAEFTEGNLVCRASDQLGTPWERAVSRCSANGGILRLPDTTIGGWCLRKLRLTSSR
ncbi:hypothetical protein [Mycolicibacterium fortuitum]|uniref:hypothetical protein n=1 Tax=Mycolicibacterium fortuitum TaxID=1766 RepID=UPI001F458DEA|nr:hypothetical protein [Mycolicibacterium fortuitum]